MRREQLLAEIAQLDEEINRTIAATELPRINVRPFPLGIWMLTGLCFAWLYFGHLIPGAYSHHLYSAPYAKNLGLICLILAILATLNWAIRGRGYVEKNEAYVKASRRARDLQERRRELQSELRAISGE